MTRTSDYSESIELIERARSHAIWARRHLRARGAGLAGGAGEDQHDEVVRAKRLLVAASQALGTAAMDSALPTKVTKTLVDAWAGLDAFLLAAGELDEAPTSADAQQLLTRAATFLIEALPGRDERIRVGTG
jgi:hypothetical protein